MRPDESRTGDELLAMLRAERKLAELDWHEDLARLAETSPSEVLRQQFAARFARVIGIPPDGRQELRRLLEETQGHGFTPVEEIVRQIRGRYAKG